MSASMGKLEAGPENTNNDITEDELCSISLLEDGVIRKSHPKNKQVSSDEDEINTAVLGFRVSRVRQCVVYAAAAASLGLLALVLHWRRDWLLRATHVRCHLRSASSVLIIERYKKYTTRFVHRVKTESFSAGSSQPKDEFIEKSEYMELEKPRLYIPDPTMAEFKAVSQIKYFRHKKLCYLWDAASETFYRLGSVFTGRPLDWLHAQQPLSAAQQDGRRVVYGSNSMYLPLTPLLKIIFLEVLTPFYVFQAFACALWYSDEYEYYATAIVVASLASVTAAVYQRRQNEKNLRRTIHASDVIEVVRDDGKTQTISTDELVPGDVVVVPSHRCTMSCDAVLLTGNVIVNESMLTGESVPVTKVPAAATDAERYDPVVHSRSTLFSGTHVLQTRYYRNQRVLALVTQTGFMTSKGQLVRSILYPPPVDFKLEQETYKFIGLLACIASVGMIYSTYTKMQRNVSTRDILLDVLDLITITVPPALPYAMAVGIIVGTERLRKARVFCISPRSINLAGLVNYCCFDKTGTLTEDGLDMRGVVRAWADDAAPPVGCEVQPATPGAPDTAPDAAPDAAPDHLTIGMAACHGLMLIDGELTGDPLDLKMFEATGWRLDEPEMEETAKFDVLAPTVVRPAGPLPRHYSASDDGTGAEVPLEVGIVRQFVFASALQRMSVLTRRLGAREMVLYCKGSPEMIISLSQPDTVPAGIETVLARHTQRGFRVLALAWRPLPRLNYVRAQRIEREQVECELRFLGLLVFENRLKPQSRGVLRDLSNADIKTVMVTGDNVLTALSVAHDSGLIPAGTPVVSVTTEWTPGAPVPRVVYRRVQAPPADGAAQTPSGDAAITVLDSKDCALAVSGPDFEAICHAHRAVAQRLSVRGLVFARMRPHHKQMLVETIKELGYHVAMCGDGANDCGALKAAHTGVSLSEAEASVASPFTSQEPNISCVPAIIREGRSALVTSFGVFKYMAAYSLTQFASVLILYEQDNNLADFQFLYIDFFLITVFAGLFGMTRSYQGALSRHVPSSRLVSLTPILSILLQLLLVAAVQIWAYWDVQQQPWYVPYTPAGPDEDDDFSSHTNFAVYTVSTFQYITLVVVFSRGPPHRQPIYTNLWFMLAILVNTAFCVWTEVWPAGWIVSWLELVVPPQLSWRLLLLGVAVGQLLVALLVESVLVQGLVHQKLVPRLHELWGKRPAYAEVAAQIRSERLWWPPLEASGRPSVSVAGAGDTGAGDAGGTAGAGGGSAGGTAGAGGDGAAADRGQASAAATALSAAALLRRQAPVSGRL